MRAGWLVAVVIASAVPARADDAPSISLADARTLLGTGPAPGCTEIPCLIDIAYAADKKAGKLAQDLYATTGDVAGVGPPEIMDGGFRGKIKLVPQLPTGTHRRHLQWTAAAMLEIERFFAALYSPSAQAAPSEPLPRYRWRALQFRFVQSPGKRTPSAYAFGWSIEYNVNGSLLTSAPGVLETLWHELFHTNDFAHDAWSEKTLQRDYDAIVRRCGAKAKCFDAYAPNTTKVRATGMYYAFQTNNGNGVHEYAAELAVRYFREQSQMLETGKLKRRAFKCGPAENARAWDALVAEFFAGKDLVPAC